MSWYIKVLNQYFDFATRARRREFWNFWLVTVIIAFAFGVGDQLIGTDYRLADPPAGLFGPDPQAAVR